jgi:Transketolase
MPTYGADTIPVRHERPKIATRQASQLVIDVIAEALPNLLGGSADLPIRT